MFLFELVFFLLLVFLLDEVPFEKFLPDLDELLALFPATSTLIFLPLKRKSFIARIFSSKPFFTSTKLNFSNILTSTMSSAEIFAFEVTKLSTSFSFFLKNF